MRGCPGTPAAVTDGGDGATCGAQVAAGYARHWAQCRSPADQSRSGRSGDAVARSTADTVQRLAPGVAPREWGKLCPQWVTSGGPHGQWRMDQVCARWLSSASIRAACRPCPALRATRRPGRGHRLRARGKHAVRLAATGPTSGRAGARIPPLPGSSRPGRRRMRPMLCRCKWARMVPGRWQCGPPVPIAAGRRRSVSCVACAWLARLSS